MNNEPLQTSTSLSRLTIVSDNAQFNETLSLQLKNADLGGFATLSSTNLLHLIENKSSELRLLIVDLDTTSNIDLLRLLSDASRGLGLVLTFTPDAAAPPLVQKIKPFCHLLPKPISLGTLLEALKDIETALDKAPIGLSAKENLTDELKAIRDLNNHNTVILNSFSQIQELMNVENKVLRPGSPNLKVMTYTERGLRSSQKLRSVSSQLQARIKLSFMDDCK